MRDPVPFVPPPAMPSDLRQRFEDELYVYQQSHAAEVSATKAAEGVTAFVAPRQGKTNLADIIEEAESPARAGPAYTTASGAGRKLQINVPKWTSSRQIVPLSQPYALVDNASVASIESTNEDRDWELDTEGYDSWQYDSSDTTLANSECSRPGSSASGNKYSSAPASSLPPRTSSLTPHNQIGRSEGIEASTHRSLSNVLPPELRPSDPTARVNDPRPDKQKYSYTYNISSTLRRSESLPVLFPSPSVKPQPGHGLVSQGLGAEPRNPFDNIAPYIKTAHESSSTPQISVQAPSPQKSSITRKRAPSSSAKTYVDQHQSQRARRSDTTGLPVLSPDVGAIWRLEFPGNTNALLTILLTWSTTMWTLHHRLPDSKLFAVHPVFAYRIDPPTKRNLVSVSFYDTSVDPHQEVRFLGPGDGAEMSYHEVDVFDDPDEQIDDQPTSQSNSPVGMIKQTLGMRITKPVKSIRYMSMSERAKTGQGRWCYVLIKGHEPQAGQTAPHVILAWHIDAVTAVSECLHTISPDKTLKLKPQPKKDLKRLSSLQNLGTALRKPTKFNFQQTLRSMSSSSELTPVDAGAGIQLRGAATLHRTVLKMGKAGVIPLIEGYRVDIVAFRGWMEACGKGSGKVIMWREMDGK